MRFTADTAALAQGLRAVAAIISPQNTLPALDGIAVDAESAGIVRLTATDLTTELTAAVPAEVTESGSLVLPAETLVALVARIPTPTVRVTADAETAVATLTYGKNRTKIKGFPPTEMPRFSAPDPNEPICTWTLDAGAMAALSRQTLFATAKDAGRPILGGVQMTVRDNQMQLIGTDGTRLSQAATPVSDLSGTPPPVVVTRRALMEAARLAGSDSAILTHQGDRLCLETLHGTVTTRYLAGTYPDVRRALPDPTDALVTVFVDARAFRAAVERINVVALRTRAPALALRYAPGRIELDATAADVGQAFEVLDVTADGPGADAPMALDFDPRLLLDGLKSLDAPVIAVSLFAADRPVRLTAADPSPYFHVVLPLRPAG